MVSSRGVGVAAVLVGSVATTLLTACDDAVRQHHPFRQEHPCVTASRAAKMAAPLDTGGHGWAELRFCGTLGADAAVAGLRRLRRIADERLIAERVERIQGFADAAVLAAALDLATDEGASTAMRVHALALAMSIAPAGQHASYEMMTTVGRDGRPTCRSYTPSHPGGYPTQWYGGRYDSLRAPAPGHVTRIRTVARSLSATGGPPEVLTAARCVLENVLPEVDARSFRARYLCDNTFEVENLTDAKLILRYGLVGREDQDLLFLGPNARQRVWFLQGGPLELRHTGRVLQTVPHGATTCTDPTGRQR